LRLSCRKWLGLHSSTHTHPRPPLARAEKWLGLHPSTHTHPACCAGSNRWSATCPIEDSRVALVPRNRECLARTLKLRAEPQRSPRNRCPRVCALRGERRDILILANVYQRASSRMERVGKFARNPSLQKNWACLQTRKQTQSLAAKHPWFSVRPSLQDLYIGGARRLPRRTSLDVRLRRDAVP